jgi:AAA family ATP:ADP antiporter
MLAWLSRRLRLETDETRHALVLGLVLFSLTSSYTLVKTARDALYLASLPAESLPRVYIGVGLLSLIAAAAFTRFTRRLSTLETLSGSAMLSAISLAAFAWLFGFDAPWVPVALYLWVNVYGLLLIAQFWVFANSVSNPREAKRIYGTIGVGGILGGLFGGMAAPGLAAAWGLPALMIAAALLLGAGVAAVTLSVRRSSLPAAEEVRDAGDPGRPVRHPYVRWLAVAALCSVVVTGMLDYVFKVQIQARYATPGSLAAFLGMYYTVVNLASLTMQLFVTRWAMQKLGAGWSAALLPAGLGVGAAFIVAIPGFASVVATRIWDQLTRQSVNRSAVEMFYFPLEPALRRRVKSLIEAGLERIGDGLAGAVILVLGVAMGAHVQTVAAVVVLLVAVWVVAWLAIRRRYVAELGRNLRRMNLAPEQMTVSLREASVLSEIDRLIDSDFERIVLHAMDLMQEAAPQRLAERLPALLDHPSAAVRARALDQGLALELPGLGERIDHMLGDAVPEVRVAALRARAALDAEDPTGILDGFLNGDDPGLRLTALQCLIEYTPAHEEPRVLARVEPLARDGTVDERRAIAEALGRRPGTSVLHELLGPLLRDPAAVVRRAAMRSAGAAQLRVHAQTLIEALADRSTQRAAREGLAGYGDLVTGTLADWMIDPSIALAVRREIPRVLGDIATADALAALFRYRVHDDVRLSYRVLKALQRVRGQRESLRMPRRLITEDLQHDARSYVFAFVHYRSCPIGGQRSAERLLCIALNERMEQALDRMFRRLALLYPPRDIYAAYRGLMTEDRRARGNAIEYLDNALDPDHRSILAPFIDDIGDEGLLAHAERSYGFRFVGYHESLDAMLSGDDPWLRALALWVVGARREQSLAEGVMRNLADRNPQVRETARWAQAALAAG